MEVTWESVKDEWSKAEQMGYQSVLQAARVGQMLIELKEATPHGEFMTKCTRVCNLDRGTSQRLMTLARHLPLLLEKQPDSQRAALALIKKENEPKEKDMGFNWIDIAAEEGLFAASSNASTRKATKAEIETVDDRAISDKDGERLRVACRVVLAMRNAQNEDAAKAEAEQAKNELPKSAQDKLDRAIKKWQVVIIADMRKQFNEQIEAAKAELQLERDAVWTMKREAEAERDAAIEYRKGIDSHMTQDEFRLIRACLHADRVPEELKERFDKAFVIFNRLEKTVNTKLPISVLRDRGWEKKSPFHKTH